MRGFFNKLPGYPSDAGRVQTECPYRDHDSLSLFPVPSALEQTLLERSRMALQSGTEVPFQRTSFCPCLYYKLCILFCQYPYSTFSYHHHIFKMSG